MSSFNIIKSNGILTTIFIIILITTFDIQAQKSVYGQIANVSGEKLQSITVTLKDTLKSKIKSYFISDNYGNYMVKVPKECLPCLLDFQYLGYKKETYLINYK